MSTTLYRLADADGNVISGPLSADALVAQVNPALRTAFDAMRDALDTIYEVDDMGDGQATVNIDYDAVTRARRAVDALRPATRLNHFGREVCSYCGYAVPQHGEDCDRP